MTPALIAASFLFTIEPLPTADAAPSRGADQTLELAGSKVRTVFFLDLYRVTVRDTDGSLTPADLDAPDRPIEVRLDVLYGGSMPPMPDSWAGELEPVLPEDKMALLRERYRAFTEGDEVLLSYDPAGGSTITHNGETLVDDEGYDLMRGALRIWFGDTPVSEGFKAAFLERP